MNRPGILDVLVEASKFELITVQIGDRFLDETETAEFWQVARGLPRLSSSQMLASVVLEDDESRLWIIFNLPEGRAVQMSYSVAAGLLTDSLGAEAYRVPGDWLVNVLGADAPRPGEPSNIGGRAIEQDTRPGSPLWWLVSGWRRRFGNRRCDLVAPAVGRLVYLWHFIQGEEAHGRRDQLRCVIAAGG